MKNIWLTIIKPKGTYAKWLIFLTLAGILYTVSSGHFDVLRAYLDTPALTFAIGQEFSITAYQALKAAITIAVLFWVTAIIADVAENRIGKIQTVRAANRALLTKVTHILLYVVAFLLTLNILGVDLTTLTVFSGAVGIGLGFGLQKIASNFISGIILLLEKSIEQGDLIELPDGTFGFVKRNGARSTLIETFDTKEILVPNEDFITNRVVNWTLSNSQGRVEIALGISYNSDIEKARDLMLEAAKEHPSCSQMHEPAVYLREFGDSSVNFILHFWVDDVTQGRWMPQSEVMFTIWKKFKENDIQIPFPQRDLHIKSSEILKVKLDGKS